MVKAEEANPSQPLDLDRLFWVGPLTVLVSIAVVLLVRVIAVALLHPPARFSPLGWFTPILFTAVLATGAVVVFALTALFAPNPIRTYQIIAAGVMLLSLWPDVAIAKSHSSGATWPYAVALMAMHVAAWATCVTILTKLTASDSTQ